MRWTARKPGTALATLFLVVFAGVAAADNIEDREWEVYTSGNASIYTSGNGELAERLLLGMHALHESIPVVPGIGQAIVDLPVELFVFPKRSDMTKLGFGRKMMTSGRSGFRKRTIVVRDWRDISELELVFRLYAHFLLDSQPSAKLPFWFHQGIAEFMIALEIHDGALEMGFLPGMYRRPFMQGPPIVMAAGTFLSAKPYQLLEDMLVGRHRLESAILVNLLLSKETQERPLEASLAAYVSLIENGADKEAAIEAATGVNLDPWVSTLRHHRFVPRKMEIPDLMDTYEPSVRAVARHEIALKLGEIALGQDDHDRASRWFGIALQAERTRSAARRGLGRLALKDGNVDASREQFEAAVALAPEDIESHLDFAEFWLSLATSTDDAATRNGYLESARENLLTAWKLDKTNAEVYFQNGRVLRLTGKDPDKAIDMLEEAAFYQPGNVEILVCLADAYWQAGRHEEALAVASTIETIDHYGTYRENVRRIRGQPNR